MGFESLYIRVKGGGVELFHALRDHDLLNIDDAANIFARCYALGARTNEAECAALMRGPSADSGQQLRHLTHWSYVLGNKEIITAIPKETLEDFNVVLGNIAANILALVPQTEKPTTYVPSAQYTDWSTVDVLNATFEIKKIIGDGNCLFRAVSLAMYDTEDKHPRVRDLAVKAAELALTPYMEDGWIENMSREKSWGDNLAVKALCIAFDVCIRILRKGMGDDSEREDLVVKAMTIDPNISDSQFVCGETEQAGNMITLLLSGPGEGTHFELLYPKNNSGSGK